MQSPRGLIQLCMGLLTVLTMKSLGGVRVQVVPLKVRDSGSSTTVSSRMFCLFGRRIISSIFPCHVVVMLVLFLSSNIITIQDCLSHIPNFIQ